MAYLEWTPATTLGIALSMTLSDLGNSSIALEVLLGIGKRSLQQR